MLLYVLTGSGAAHQAMFLRMLAGMLIGSFLQQLTCQNDIRNRVSPDPPACAGDWPRAEFRCICACFVCGGCTSMSCTTAWR